jgi:pimeloyl-ACP methyl ester carboxylesterase
LYSADWLTVQSKTWIEPSGWPYQQGGRLMKPRKLLNFFTISACLFALSSGHAVYADGNDFTRVDGEISGASFSLFRPENWNGDLVLLVHGSIPEEFEALASELVAGGFGVAFTALPPGSGEGSALKEITIATRMVEAQFTSHFGQPGQTYLFGSSRGAHNMSQLLETSPAKYSGMLSVCGGNGGTQLQWDHFFTARILFDYYFPGVLPGTPERMPALDPDTFLGTIAPDVITAISLNPLAAIEMASVDQYDLRYNDLEELVSGIVQSLAIHSIGVNDLLSAANGNPFDNTLINYTGTGDDVALNAGIVRLRADQPARQYLRVWYEPSGSIGSSPVLLLHTSRDPIVPESANNDKYEALVQSTGNEDFLVRRVVDRFGHCTFSPAEIASSFTDLIAWVEAGIRPIQ